MRSPWSSIIFSQKRGHVTPERARGGLARYLLIILLPLVLGPLVTVAVLLYRQAQADLTRTATAQLISLTTLKATQIDQWAAARTGDMSNLARSPDVIAAAQALVLKTQGAAGAQQAQDQLQQRFADFLSSMVNSDFEALLLVNADTGQALMASDEYAPLRGTTLQLDEQFFRAARIGALTAFPPFEPGIDVENADVMAGAPVADPQRGTIAVLIGLIHPRSLADLLAPSPGLGSGSRTYLMTRDGYELGIALSAQSSKLSSLGIEQAVQNHQTGSATYTDPTGQRVLGAYMWLPRYEIALLVEQTVAEAYAPLSAATTIFANTMAVAAVVGTLGVLLFTRSLTRPIQNLTDSAVRMAGGDLTTSVRIERQDEIGLLAQTFNTMVDDLRRLYQSLEQQVEARTRQLAAAAEVGRAATSILGTEELLSKTIELIRDRFGYYHASVFLIDDAGQFAVLRESTGEVGAKLKARGHRLAVGSNSIIGWVTANQRPRIALDVGEDPIHLKNELLPDTRSEAAVPLRIGDRVLGALDVQSREANAFTQTDIEALQVLADQIAVAIENGRLFARQQRVVKLEHLVATLTARIHQTPSLDSILEGAATELGRAFGAQKVVVRLTPPREGGPAQAAGGNGHDQEHDE